MRFSLVKQTGKQLVQMDVADIELLFNYLCREVVKHNQIITYDENCIFIILVAERLRYQFFQMCFADEFYGERWIFYVDVRSVLQQPEAFLLITAVAVGNAENLTPAAGAVDKLPNSVLRVKISYAAGI